jgi:hypothetical protein
MMRKEPNLRIEQYRYTPAGFESPAGVNYGAFRILFRGVALRVISSGHDEENGWEHVSVSLNGRCPTWAEMQHVKELFWRDDETVVQFHPARSQYINNMPHCLHMWRQIGEAYRLPPGQLIGVPELNVTNDQVEA